MPKQSLYQFQHPVVRDLAWVMQSPSLVTSLRQPDDSLVTDDYCRHVFEEQLSWLHELDRNPSVIVDFLSRRPSSRLGYYFEDLVAFWLKQKISRNLFASHIKVSSSGRDLGEFDFLFQENAKCLHWEIAVKFYLYHSDVQGKVNWFGPNAIDTLQKKLHRMLSHQLRLAELPEAQAVLSEQGIDKSNLSSKIFLKGYLFYPLNLPDPDYDFGIENLQISQQHLRGWWLSEDELTEQSLRRLDERELHWQQLPKKHWLAPRCYSQGEAAELFSGSQIVSETIEHFKNTEESLLLAGYSACDDGVWQERTRGFIVSRRWPDQKGRAEG